MTNSAMDHQLRISLFGGLFLEVAGQPVTELKTQKEAVLVAYLALAQRPFTREHLANLFWDDREAKQAQSNLRTLLSRLRSALGDYLDISRQQVAILPERVWVDVLEFDALAAQVGSGVLGVEDVVRLETAVSLYQGEFMAGVTIPDSEGLEVWQIALAERLHHDAVAVYQRLALHFLYHRDTQAALRHARAYHKLEPLREDGHRLLMRLLARDGQLNAALAQYQQCASLLAAELGVEPENETQLLYQRLLRARNTSPAHLPHAPTPFIARVAELAAIDARLDEENGRLITILGTGGVGKTRLAVQAAQLRQHEFINGVVFVSVAHVQTAAQIANAIGQAVGLTFAGTASPQQELFHFLQHQELLLLLDNVEHLLGDSGTTSFLQALLTAVPDLKLLVTSRQRLNLRAERVVRLEGLPYPTDLTTVTDGAKFAALDLLRQCARLQDMALPDEELPQAAHICRLVEGLPLALELAAATLDSFSLAHIAAQIQTNLDFLQTQMVDVPPRQRSVRAVFAYSWELLTNAEQVVLAELSIFQGQFSLAAATAVTRATALILQNLVHKSLLRATDDDHFELHMLIRQFAREQLPPDTAVWQQHASWYLQLLGSQESHLVGEMLPDALAVVRAALDNIRAAWQTAVTHNMQSLLAQSIPSLTHLAPLLGIVPEVTAWLAEARANLNDVTSHLLQTLLLAESELLIWQHRLDEAQQLVGEAATLAVPEMDASVAVKLQLLLAEIFFHRGGLQTAVSHAQQAIELAENGRFPHLAARGYQILGNLQGLLGQAEQAISQLQKALQLFHEQNDRLGEAETLHMLGLQRYYLGQFGQSRHSYEQSLKLKEAVGAKAAMAATYTQFGLLATDTGQFAEAVELYQKALQLERQSGDRRREGAVLHNLGLVSQHLRAFSQARLYYQQAIQLARENGETQREAITLGNLGDVAYALGNFELAQRYYAEALALREQLNDLRGITWLCCSNAMIANTLGNYTQAEEFASRAIQLAKEQNERPRLAFALTYWADARAGQGDLTAARKAHEEALHIRQAIKQEHLATVQLTRLGQMALQEEDLDEALIYVEQLLPYLLENPLGNLRISGETAVFCYRVLAILQDHRADEVLYDVFQALQEVAAKFEEDIAKATYLSRVAAHHQIMLLMETQ